MLMCDFAGGVFAAGAEERVVIALFAEADHFGLIFIQAQGPSCGFLNLCCLFGALHCNYTK